jgi:glycogen synthase
MRVLLASQEMPPETAWGGIGTYVANLAPALAALGADVHVLSVVRGQGFGDRVLAPGLTVHRRPLRRPPGLGRVTGLHQTWERLTLPAAVDRQIRALEIEPDVVEAPEWRAEGLVCGLRRTAPLVVRLHSAAEQLFGYSSRPRLDARLATALERRSMQAADLLVSTASTLLHARAALAGAAPPTRAIALPVAPGRPGERPGPAPRVVFVGRLERRKGPEILVAAARSVLERVPEARFAFIGADTGRAPGSYRAMLEELGRRHRVGAALEFRGHLDHAETMEQIRRATLCVFPARMETFGYAAAEAASCGVPVIASAIAAFRSLFGDEDSAHLVDGEDPVAWGRAIASLLEDPSRAERLGRAGRARILATCAPARIAEETLDVYEQARRGRGCAP